MNQSLQVLDLSEQLPPEDPAQVPAACAIFHSGRVGSTVLATSLTSLPIIPAGEIYNHAVYPAGPWWEQWDFIEHYRRLFRRRLQLPQPYTNDLPRAGARWYLFEYKPFFTGCTVPLAEAVERFRSAGVTKFVSLKRRNPIRRYVSLLIALKTGVWHTHSPSSTPTAVRLDVKHLLDTDLGFTGGTLLQWLDHQHQVVQPLWDAVMASAGALELQYEQHIEQDPHVAYRLLRDHLGFENDIEPAPFEFVRQNAQPLRELLSNFDEVREALDGTPYGAFLDG